MSGDPILQPETNSPEKNSWTRLRDYAKSASSLIPLASLVISGLSFAAAQQANDNAARAQEATSLTRYADRVSYFPVGNQQIAVQNRSNQPLQWALVQVQAVSVEPGLTSGDTVEVGIGLIGDCSTKIADVAYAARLALVGYTPATPPSNVGGVSVPSLSLRPVIHSEARAAREVLKFIHNNGFKVHIDFLQFADVMGVQWERKNGSYLMRLHDAGYVPDILAHATKRDNGC